MQYDKSLVLVDGSSYLYRAFHGMPELTNEQGFPTGAIFGMLNMLMRILNQREADTDVAVVFDPKGQTVRHKIYAEYKANRAAMPDALKQQVPIIHNLIDALGLPIFMVPGQEADDVIATISQRAIAAGYHVVISTGDKDFAQLVNAQIELVNTMTNTRLDVAGVEAKFGVRPDQIIDYLALIGDSADNVPGVDKVGPKTAVKWLTQYGSIERLLRDAPVIKGKVGENLRQSTEKLALAQTLVTINQDVDIPGFSLSKLATKERDIYRLAEIYRTYGFKKQLQALDLPDPEHTVPAPTCDYRAILQKEDLNTLVALLDKHTVIALDTETNSLNTLHACLVGLSFSVSAHAGFYIPLGHVGDDQPEQLSWEVVKEALQPILLSEHKHWVGQNIKYDYQVLRQHGVTLRGQWFDTMLLSYVYDSNAGRHNLTALAERFLHVGVTAFEQVVGVGKNQQTFDQVDVVSATHYAAEDADIALRLYHHLWPALQESGLDRVYQSLEAPLIPVLADLEHAGILLDTSALSEQAVRINGQLEKIVAQIYDLAGEPFNIASTKQLRVILFEKLGLPILKKTPSKQAATSEEVLTALCSAHPIAEQLLQYRTLTKLLSTYIEKLPQQIDPQTGRVHGSFNQAVTSTGRLSSTDPNLQNIPVKHAEGRLIRKAFIAPEGCVLLAADYSQIELRIMAHLSADKSLCQAFAAGQDVHAATAAEVFSVALDQVTDNQRRHAKAINFGLMYGMSAFGLAKQLGVGRHDAQSYIDCYFARYPGVKDFMDQAVDLAKSQGYVETILGRRLYMPGIHDRNAMVRKAAERAAINAPMQGSAADIIKLAMSAITDRMAQAHYPARLLLQVHDELVFEVQAHAVDQMRQAVDQAMTSVVDLKVPLEVSIGVAKNWCEAH